MVRWLTAHRQNVRDSSRNNNIDELHLLDSTQTKQVRYSQTNFISIVKLSTIFVRAELTNFSQSSNFDRQPDKLCLDYWHIPNVMLLPKVPLTSI